MTEPEPDKDPGPAAPGSDVAGPAAPGSDVAGPAAPDPWRGFRGVMAATLLLEAIVVLLAIPVVAVVGRGLNLATGAYLIGVAVVLVALAGLQSRPWAIWVNLAMQLVVIAGVVVHPSVGFVGGLFAAVWLLLLYLRMEVLRRQRLGELPGQQRPE